MALEQRIDGNTISINTAQFSCRLGLFGVGIISTEELFAAARVFSRDVVLGGGGGGGGGEGNCFCGERKCEECPKNKRNSLLFGGLGGGGGGEFKT